MELITGSYDLLRFWQPWGPWLAKVKAGETVLACKTNVLSHKYRNQGSSPSPPRREELLFPQRGQSPAYPPLHLSATDQPRLLSFTRETSTPDGAKQEGITLWHAGQGPCASEGWEGTESLGQWPSRVPADSCPGCPLVMYTVRTPQCTVHPRSWPPTIPWLPPSSHMRVSRSAHRRLKFKKKLILVQKIFEIPAWIFHCFIFF